MCTFCDGDEPAALIITVQANGETVGVGAACLPTYGLVLAGVTPSLIEQAAAAILEIETAAAPTPGGDTTGPAAEPAATRPRRSPSKRAGAGARRRRSDEPSHRRKVHDELAGRPDAAATSAKVVPEPDAG